MTTVPPEDDIRVGDRVKVRGFKGAGKVLYVYPDGIIDVEFSVRVQAEDVEHVRVR